jgi:O-antigen ligase
MKPPLGNNFPSSVKADYETMNALRTFVIQASAISLACGILVGIQRRKSALIILWSFVTSGVAMGFVAILQKLSGTEKLLWIVETLNPNCWGTFAYRNQAAAFLILTSIILCLLYFYYLKKSRISKIASNNGGPHFLCLFYIFLLFASIWLALSRGGIIIGSVLALVFFVLALSNSFFYNRLNSSKGTFLLFGIFFLSGALFFSQLSDWAAIQKRIQHFEEIKENIEIYDRTLSSKATWDMAQDRKLFGWGAGSFRYIFPIYQKSYETIWYHWKSKKRGWQGRRIYDYAHNYWLQFLAEYGVLGCTFLGGIFMCICISGIKLFVYTKTAGSLMLCGISLIFIHNFVDFIFSSPAYWAAFWGSIFLILKLYELENKASSHPE